MRSATLQVLLAITFFYPIVLCAVFFPTPASDLREHINLGLTFPFYTWKNPALQSWIAGLVALTGARDAWLYVFVAQVLNFIGLAYLVQTAKKFIGIEAGIPLLIMFSGSLCYSAAVPSVALNADQIQVPIWSGFLYHALSAARDNRWRDWLPSGAFIVLGFFAKYSSVVILTVLLGTAVWLPAYRGIFTNKRLYIVGLLAATAILLSFVPQLLQTNVLHYGATKFNPWASLGARASSGWQLLRLFAEYGGPALLGLFLIARHGWVSRPRLPSDPAQLFMVLSAIGVVIAILMMIVFGGLRYEPRYGYLFFGLWLLALNCVIHIEPQALRTYANIILVIWAFIIVGTLIYSQIAIHRTFREPAPAAAVIIRQNWDHQFSCGPAYVIGTFNAAHAIAIYFGRPVVGLAFDEVEHINWFDNRLKELGAIVIADPNRIKERGFTNWFADKTFNTLTLPYRRTLQTAQHTYQYYFIPPQGCPTPVRFH